MLRSLKVHSRECVVAASLICLVVSFSNANGDLVSSRSDRDSVRRNPSRFDPSPLSAAGSVRPIVPGSKRCDSRTGQLRPAVFFSESDGQHDGSRVGLAAIDGQDRDGDASVSHLLKPNVIVMMADDMGLGDTSAYQDFTGNSDADQLHTPSMERLAKLGVRFTDAHTPSSRCTLTRYSLMTGRYSWRNRLKHFVLFGVQGDPMIERDRPTLATLFQSQGYSTGIVGKWHIGLRYRRANGNPAAAWEDADLTQPLFDSPLDHGFEFVRVTSRSHGTSGPDAGATTPRKKLQNSPKQSIGPGHIHGRQAVSAAGRGKELIGEGANAYVLSRLGSRHSDNSMQYLTERDAGKPFFLYYACNSNHSPYTPDSAVGDKPVKGAARSVSGEPLEPRADFIYENDVALGRLLDWLEKTDDSRRSGHKLIDNTIVIFTSDNGAERDRQVATGPFRSNKGSVYEGGHRVPFLVSWPAGGLTGGKSSDELIGLQDLYATFSDVLSVSLPDLVSGEKGAEDSGSVLAAWRGQSLGSRTMFFNDHKQSEDRAAAAIRIDDPVVDGTVVPGQWKLFFDGSLLREGRTNPVELFDLATDPTEMNDRLGEARLKNLVVHLSRQALLHRTGGGHRLAGVAPDSRTVFRWAAGQVDSTGQDVVELVDRFSGQSESEVTVQSDGLKMKVTARAPDAAGDSQKLSYHLNPRGLGIAGGEFGQVDGGESLEFVFDQDVLIESCEVVAGNGACGGFYTVGDHAPLAIYCVDADNDSQSQEGILGDIGILKAGQKFVLSSAPHYGVENQGQWRLKSLSIRRATDGRATDGRATEQ